MDNYDNSISYQNQLILITWLTNQIGLTNLIN